ncbi:MAG: MOSC domain-containing protein [Gammaproteobacteria bacterium]|nr:MOSC domain-containing protein [Gammaproteobacteria bacterium]
MQKVVELKQHFPYPGKVEWIGVRSHREAEIGQISSVKAVTDHGLEGDKAGKRSGGKRQVTLFQAEYINVIRSLMPNSNINLADLRRNIAVSGINLNALKDCTILVGEANLEVTGYCHPCSKLESQLGTGVFNALRGHGGITAKVTKGGLINLGDEIQVLKFG